MPDEAGGRDDPRDWLVARSGGGDAQMAPLEDVLPLHSAALYQTLRGTLPADSAAAPVLARARILVAPGRLRLEVDGDAYESPVEGSLASLNDALASVAYATQESQAPPL
jgi:hypothetical protein